MAPGVYIAIIVVSIVIRLIIKAAKSTPTPPPRQNSNPYNNPPYNNPSMKQPPPFVPPSQNPTTDFSNLFDEQKSSYQQPTSSTPSSVPSMDELTSNFNNIFNKQNSPPPFDNQQGTFSNMPSRNTNSNMGAGSQSYYCMYCGKKFQSTATLKMDTCFKHPKSDMGLQKHVLYMGAGKPNIGF